MNKILLINRFIYTFFCFIFFVLYIFTHEQIHKQIAIYHGCTDYKINYGLSDNNFKCLKYQNRPDSIKISEIQMHSLNEIVAYPLQAFLSLFILIGFFLIKDEKKDT